MRWRGGARPCVCVTSPLALVWLVLLGIGVNVVLLLADMPNAAALLLGIVVAVVIGVLLVRL
ncbi:MAG TPA: hypothetical protein VKV26_03725 [Dehalococcoidia bacterium]|nr:hypothetical protein [Dehalococcoidia bacterium]